MMIGCQFSLYPMTDRFIAVILDAIADLKTQEDLRVETDDLSTLLVGTSDKIFTAVENCFLKASQSADHVVLNVTFSRGCPGEPDDPCCQPLIMETKNIKSLKKQSIKKTSGIQVAAQFALYPFGSKKYMAVIYREIEQAKKTRVTVKPKNFCTRLDGDATNVFATLKQAFDNTAEDVAHVVLTATISKKSKKNTVI